MVEGAPRESEPVGNDKNNPKNADDVEFLTQDLDERREDDKQQNEIIDAAIDSANTFDELVENLKKTAAKSVVENIVDVKAELRDLVRKKGTTELYSKILKKNVTHSIEDLDYTIKNVLESESLFKDDSFNLLDENLNKKLREKLKICIEEELKMMRQ